MLLVFILPSDNAVANGKSFTFWSAGMQLYLMAIVLSNLTVLKLQSLSYGWNEVLMLAHVICFFVILYLWQD